MGLKSELSTASGEVLGIAAFEDTHIFCVQQSLVR